MRHDTMHGNEIVSSGLWCHVASKPLPLSRHPCRIRGVDRVCEERITLQCWTPLSGACIAECKGAHAPPTHWDDGALASCTAGHRRPTLPKYEVRWSVERLHLIVIVVVAEGYPTAWATDPFRSCRLPHDGDALKVLDQMTPTVHLLSTYFRISDYYQNRWNNEFEMLVCKDSTCTLNWILFAFPIFHIQLARETVELAVCNSVLNHSFWQYFVRASWCHYGYQIWL